MDRIINKILIRHIDYKLQLHYVGDNRRVTVTLQRTMGFGIDRQLLIIIEKFLSVTQQGNELKEFMIFGEGSSFTRKVGLRIIT